MKKRMIVCGFLLCLIISGCSSYTYETTPNPQKEVGTQISDLAYEDHYVISIHYPKTENEELDSKIDEVIHMYQDQFLLDVLNYKEERLAEFNVTYQSYMKNDRYISIKLEFFQNIYQEKTMIETLVYDTKNEEFIDLYDIYDKDEIAKLADMAKAYFENEFPNECNSNQFKIGISPTLDNFNTFVLRKDAFILYFNEGNLFDRFATFEIPYEKIAPYTDLKREERATFVPYDQVLNEPVKLIDESKPMVALTFDDGPTKKYTPAILDALKEYNASATFFVLGTNAENQPAILQRMVLEGNEIGNHTYSHKQLTTLSKAKIEDEIEHTQESIFDITGKAPQMIRPPYGSKNDTVLNSIQDKKIVTWTIDTEDWRSKNAHTIVNKVLDQVKDGDIILMHDMYASSAEAAIILIPELQSRGFQLVTVSELYQYGKNDAGKIL